MYSKLGGYESNLEPSYDTLSPLNQRFDLVLKSPWITVKKGLADVTASMFNSKLFAIDPKSSWGWFSKRYKETNLHSLSPIIISNLMHSFNYWKIRIFKGKVFLK